MKAPLPLLVLAVLLAGCQDAAHLFGVAPDCTVSIGTPQLGHEAEYVGAGKLRFPGLNYVIVDWRIVDPSGPREWMVTFPEGTKVGLTFGAGSQRVPTTSGAWVEAIPVSYQVTLDAGPSIRGAVEYLDADGRAVFREMPNSLWVDEDWKRRYGRPGEFAWPPVWGASWFWGSTVADGQSGMVLSTPVHHTVPGNVSLATLEWKAKVEPRDGACEAVIAVDGNSGDCKSCADPAMYLTFRDGDRLPRAIARTDQTWLLQREHEGAGAPAPRFQPSTVVPQSALPSAETRHGFLDEAGSPFATTFARARQAVLDDVGGTWLRDHPGAMPSEATHRLGRPGGDTVDAWSMRFRDADEGME